ncbi:MAG: hypothetical protein FWD49_02620 [Firmicutes bacterium]|nr:hypothetical protein [Bacillota bacterium]
MKVFIIKENHYLNKDIVGFYRSDYVGYQKEGNPDFINKLKNMTRVNGELDLIEEFVTVAKILTEDLGKLTNIPNYAGSAICAVPRSKADCSYHKSQLLFKKALASVADSLNCENCTDAIKRVSDTKTTHNWRLKNNKGSAPYKGITKDTCKINSKAFKEKNVILVDDIYTDGVHVVDDCIQTLLDLGAKNVLLYVVAKTLNKSA